jgi:hypothetical protein
MLPTVRREVNNSRDTRNVGNIVGRRDINSSRDAAIKKHQLEGHQQ